jgi:hypothetical protein
VTLWSVRVTGQDGQTVRQIRRQIMAKTKKKTEKCLVEDCPLKVKGRSLCSTHFKQARKAINEGEADEDDLVKRGLMSPRKIRRGLPSTDAAIFKKGSKVKGRGAKGRPGGQRRRGGSAS